MGIPGAKWNLRQKLKKKIQNILNFEFCLSFEFAPVGLHFPLLRTLKIILYTKVCFFSKNFHEHIRKENLSNKIA